MGSPIQAGRERHGQWLALFSLLLCVAVSVPLFAVSPAQGAEESVSVSEVPAPSASEVAEAEGEEREHAEWLASPEAEAQREASGSAYTNLTAGEAQSLLVESFSRQLKALNADPARVLSALEVEKSLGTYGALVSDDEGESAILNSSAPVQSDLGGEGEEPVDLALERSGSSFVPQNPITEVELPGSAEEPIQLESGVEVELPTSDDHGAVPLGAMNLFYPETETATDTLISPRAGGVEVFEQLRSPESPERFSFALNLPAKSSLRPREDGGAEVVAESGEVIEEVLPPSAADAQGSTVPVTTNIEGDSLVLEVPHRSRDLAYPILLDPVYVEGGASFANWVPAWNDQYILWNSPVLGAQAKGSSYSYAANSYGQWAWTTYGSTTYISQATFSPTTFTLPSNCTTEQPTNQPHGYAGLYNPGSGGYSGLGIWSGGSSSGSYATLENSGGPGVRQVIVGIGAGTSQVKHKCAFTFEVGGVTVREKDPEAPTVDWVGGTPGSWVKEITVTPHASDPGLGVKAITLSPEGASPHTNSQGCAGANGSRCPGSWETSFGVSYFLEGERSASITAYDPLGPDVSSHVSSSYQFTTRLDRQAPEVELEGEFTEALEEAEEEGEGKKAPALHLPVYNVRIEATDKAIEGDPKTEPKARRSGVKNLAVFLDGKEMKVPWSAQGCAGPQYSCPMAKTYSVPMNEVQGGGVHKLKVIAEDQVGNKRERTTEFEYFPATGMKDEYVMQRFPLPDGEGDESEEEHPVRPELAVNVTNGNLVYRQKDVEVPGPAVDLEVERFYNSQLPDEDNTEWGDGWTLAQTPRLEPEETKEGAPPAKASMVRTSGALESTVVLPAENGATQFDKKLQAVVSKEAGGYTVEDQSGETNSALAFDTTGKVTELRTSGYARADYSYEGGDLSEVAVRDPASSDLQSVHVTGALDPPVYGFAFGAYGTGNGQFASFGGIATDAAGNVYAADSGNHRVEKFDSNGAYLSQFGSSGTGNGQFGTISGIAVAPDGSVYVADSSAKRVEKFSASGSYLSQFGKEGTGEGQFGKGIGGLAVDGAGNVYASDYAGQRILKFSASGAYVGQIADSQLTNPHAIAVNAAGELWAVDWGDERIEKFNAAGIHIGQFSTAGQAALSWPQGIAVDESSGDVWVTDSETGRVVGFSASGAYLGQFGTEGLGEGQLAEPNWLAIDSRGGFYVSDPITHQVQKWVTKAVPSAMTEAAGSVVETSATLHATVNPTALDTHYSFEWGPTAAYGHSTPVSAKDIGAGAKDVKVTEKVEGLKPWVLYHYRVAATNADGTTYGADQQLTTWGEWSLESPPLPKTSTSSSLADVSCTSTVNCVAVGYDSYAGRMLGETWNGTKWTLSSGGADQNPTSISCPTATSCWAVGTQSPESSIWVEHWEEEEPGLGWQHYGTTKPLIPEGATSPRLTAINCSTATECTAVGYYTKEGQVRPLAERLSAYKWTVQTMPVVSGAWLNDISCTSASSCVAVGYKSVKGVGIEGFSMRWNGTEWSTLTAPGPKAEGWVEQRLGSIACPTAAACVATGTSTNEEGENAPYALSYNGSAWSLATLPTLKAGSSLASVSCTSASACLAVGHAAEGGTLAVGWDGSKWTTRSSLTPKEKTAWLAGVSCVGSLTCTTVGKQLGGGETTPLAERVGEIWTLESPPMPKASNSSGLSDVSCISAFSCIAVGSDSYATRGLGEVWNGEKWTLLSGEDNQAPTSVSCGSTTSCWAVGTKNTSELLVEIWEEEAPGMGWTHYATTKPLIPEGATSPRLTAINCSTATECTAVGYYTKEGQVRPLAERLSAYKWTVQTMPVVSGAWLNDISCTSASSCVAVGYKSVKGVGIEGFSMRWNGTEWSTLTAPGPKAEGWVEQRLGSIACPTAAACVATGTSTNEEGENAPYALSYNGSAWALTTLPTLKVGSTLASVSCAAAGNCLAVGHAAEGGTLALGWSGGEWTLRSSPTPKGKTAWLYGVSCLAPMTCTSVGQSTGSGETAPMADRVELRNQEATTGAAVSVTPAAATLNATVNPHGLATKYSFEYGLTKAYGTAVPAPSKEVGSGTKDVVVSNQISGLEAGRLYHYRLVATSEVGTTYGQDKTFTTPPPSFAFDFGAQGSGEGQFTSPAGVATDTEGNAYVADAGNHRVVKFNSRGGFVSAFGKEGTGEAQFTTISAIAVGPEGYVYVADSGQRKIKRFKAGGEFVSQFGAEGIGNGQFGSLIGGLAVDKGGVIWASDSSNHRVERFDSTGKYLSKIGSEGTGNGQFASPRAIAIDGAGNAWVVDLGHERVEQFSPVGAYQRQFGKPGKGAGEISSPAGIAIDAAYNVWVVDSANNRLEEWSSKGEYLSQYGEAGTGERQFSQPSSLAIDPQGSLLIADNQSRIEKWFVQRGDAIGDESVETEDDPKVDVESTKGLVDSVEGQEAGQIAYSHSGELLTAVDGPKGETQYEYDSEGRLTKVTLPNGTWGTVKYDEFGRAESVTVSVEGGKARTTYFAYKDEPRRTTVSPEGQPITVYDIAPDGSVLKWWNKQKPPEIENLSGSLYANKETSKPVEPGDYELLVQAHSVEGIASIQIVANGDQLVDEKTCEQDYKKEGTECQTLEDPWVTETANWPPGILYLEVIVTSSVEGTEAVPNTESTKFWVNIPYTPPPDPEADEPPKFNEVLGFREEFGLDLDLKGNELAIDERIFGLIGNWNNPHIPAGEIARATADSWGVPLRQQDAAELEYRERYVDQAASAIPKWAQETGASSAYAGYYVDHRDGGLIYVGFTGSQAELVAALQQQGGLAAPDRLRPFPAPPTYSLSSLESLESSVLGVAGSLPNLVSVRINVEKNRLDVGAGNVAEVQGQLESLFGSASPLHVYLRAKTPTFKSTAAWGSPTGPVRAGERIWGGGFTACSAGYGAWDNAGQRPDGSTIYRHFILTAGHCYLPGDRVYQFNCPENQGSEGCWERTIGYVRRNTMIVHESGYGTDGAAIRLEDPSLVPRLIRWLPEQDIRIKGVTTPREGMMVCVAGSSRGRSKCGAIDWPPETRRWEEIHGNGNPILTTVPYEINVKGGDSGGPVWERGTGLALGTVTGGEEEKAGSNFTPLKSLPGYPSAPGTLQALEDGEPLHIVKWKP